MDKIEKVLKIDTVDFEHVEETINNAILYVFCLSNILEKEASDIEGFKKSNLIKFLGDCLADNNKKIVNEFLRNLPKSGNVSETIKYGTYKYFCSLVDIAILTNMANRNDFREIVESEFYVIDKDKKRTETTYLYRDKDTVNEEKPDEIVYHTSLSTILTTKLILEETKTVARQCVQEKLKEYSQDVGSALAEFEEIFVEEVRRR